MKLVVNSVIAALNVTVSEALVLAERAGLDRVATYDVLAAGAVGAPYVQYKRDAFLRPDDTPVTFSLDLIAKAGPKIPLLGVCLGHQAIGQTYGGKVIRAPVPMHGKLSRVTHAGKGVFKALPQSFEVTRYHSLIVERKGRRPLRSS